ncbi:MAG TPA: protoporphyrinogen oxidase HemJ [Xanthobacteraceae bacterium]|jgi:putative membrane protein
MLELWIKALHVVVVISWMAALLYLPRLLVYHCEAEARSGQSETFKLMERRLLRFIATPAMLVAWASGLWLAHTAGVFSAGWLQVKLLGVAALTVVHGLNAKWVKDFALDQNRRSARFYRIANEVPTILMILIVVLVIVKPF